MIRLNLTLILVALSVIYSKGQQIFSGNKYPLVDFRAPLDIMPLPWQDHLEN
ncbi:hypothetical protein [Pedobacter ginsengisoli]|uniref:hypothetical protein n=1 Tax=Pedobacter ginsengisoli TaxID=363852 RepID=UPI001FEB3CBB|nr:hypothetical protein [Pedobacter ginsengisoli]